MDDSILNIITRDDDELKILFKGELEIENISLILEEVKTLLKNKKKIEIEINNTGNIELSFLQLLIAIKKTCNKQKATLKISFNIPEETESLLNSAGYEKLVEYLS